MNETSSDDDNFITENQIEKQSLNFFLQSNQNEESQEHENNIKLKVLVPENFAGVTAEITFNKLY